MTPSKIIRSKRRTLSISINDNAELIVRAPHKLSIDKIHDFIIEKEKWLNKQKKIVNKRLSGSFLDKDMALYLGSLFPIKTAQSQSNKLTFNGEEFLAGSSEQEIINLSLKKWYKNKFKEYQLAKNKLKDLLESTPEERLILPSKYNLHKIYMLLSQFDEAEIIKKDIIDNYSDSRYAAILLNPDTDLGEDENSPENLYEKLYTQFEAQNYSSVISECDKFINMLEGEAIVPKFEFLKAVSSARLFGFKSYKKAINFIALNYPNSSEGEKAQIMLKTSIPALEKKEFVEKISRQGKEFDKSIRVNLKKHLWQKLGSH